MKIKFEVEVELEYRDAPAGDIVAVLYEGAPVASWSTYQALDVFESCPPHVKRILHEERVRLCDACAQVFTAPGAFNEDN